MGYSVEVIDRSIEDALYGYVTLNRGRKGIRRTFHGAQDGLVETTPA